MISPTAPKSLNEMRPSFGPIFRYYARQLQMFRVPVILMLVSVIGASVVGIVQPIAYKLFIDQLVASAGKFSEPVVWNLITLLAIAIGIRICGALFWRISGFIASETHPRLRSNLAEEAFENIFKHSTQFFTDTFSGSLSRKVRGYADACTDIWETILWTIIPIVVLIVGIIAVLFMRKPFLAMAILAWVIILSVWSAFFVRRKMKNDIDRAAQDSVVTGIMSDSFSNSSNIKLFNGFQNENQLFGKELVKQRQLRTRGWRASEWSSVVENVLAIIAEIIAMSIVLSSVSRGTMTVGDVVLVQSYLFNMFDWMFNMNRTMRRLYESLADAKEMVDVLEMPFGVKDVPSAEDLRIHNGAIEFKDVVFNYNQTRRVLDDFCLNITPREKVAFVGSSGAGKSTIIKLLFRLYDIDGGKILIDGHDIAHVTQASLHEAISLVPQDPVLFHRSLKENIRYGRRDASDADVIAAAKQARCHDFISQLPQGYDTLVGERGVKLSGGERQRVAIARAILRNAPILVLDEATSSLDSESEALIQEALSELMKQKTVIVIAHRLSTIMQMDRIIVMQDGKVVDQGTHDELLKKVGVYQKLWNIQAGGFQSS